ncbi:MAG: HypC/HybG/HupF family hydrogenase formation chaperone [Clostridia bacterium]|nr:HypC/HybG/HupF family hydrogenase formation chaperone [Clostridia bacterium]
MCLGVPGRVEEIQEGGKYVVVDAMGVKVRASTALIDSVAVGDYLMIHAGYALEKVDPEEARERIELWEQFLAYDQSAG